MFFLVALFLLFASAVAAVEPPTWELPRLSGQVTVDGILAEPQWEKAFSWQGFVEVSPRDNAPPSRQTQVLLFTTHKALVIGFRCEDPRPEEIRRQRLRRDEVYGVDAVEIFLDPTGEAKQALYIGLSAAGDVNDGLVDSASFSFSYDALFSHGARLTSTGWQAEVVIPFTSLSFAPKGRNRMLLAINRHVPREDWEFLSFLPINRASQDPRDGMAYILVNTEGVHAARTWHLIPAWVGSSFVQEAEGRTSSSQGSFSLTGEWQPRQDTTVKATWRPDFSQVEADDTYQKVNNRYPVFIREKRPFFMEGAESFSMPFRLYYSRKIVLPEWGLKFSHRGERLGLFAIAAQEKDVPGERFGEGATKASATWGVLRGTWALDERGSFLGFTGTYRGFGSSHNEVGALDASTKGEKLSMRAQVAFSSTKGRSGSEDGSAFRWEAGYRWNEYWATNVTLERVSPHFRADAGFVVRLDRQYLGLSQSFFYLPKEEKGFFRKAEVGLSGYSERTTKGELKSEGATSYAFLTLPHRLHFSLSGYGGKERFAGQNFSGVWSVTTSLNWQEFPQFQPFVSFFRGGEVVYGESPFLGASTGSTAGLDSNFGPWSAAVSRSHYSFGDGARTQDSWQASLAFIWGQDWSAKVFYVDDDLRFRDWGWAVRSRFVNALLIYRVNPFSAVYLGANLALDREGSWPEPDWSKSETQQIFLKVSWYF